MKSIVFAGVMTLALIMCGGYFQSGMAMMGGMGHGGGGMGGHGGSGWQGHGGGGGWSGSAMGSGSMPGQGGAMQSTHGGSGHQGIDSDPGHGPDGAEHGHGVSDMQGTMDDQHPQGEEEMGMSSDPRP